MRPREVEWFDYEAAEFRRGEIEERNGGLAYVRNAETGEAEWRGAFELREEC